MNKSYNKYICENCGYDYEGRWRTTCVKCGEDHWDIKFIEDRSTSEYEITEDKNILQIKDVILKYLSTFSPIFGKETSYGQELSYIYSHILNNTMCEDTGEYPIERLHRWCVTILQNILYSPTVNYLISCCIERIIFLNTYKEKLGKEPKITKHYLTVGELKKFIEENNIPDDAHVFYERIKDFYISNHGWKTAKKYSIDSYSPVEYFETWGPTHYNGDRHLYLTAHY